MQECRFCQIRFDGVSRVLLETKHFFTFFDQFPVNSGHMLIISKRHRENIFELMREEWEDLWLALQNAKCYLGIKYHPDGYNLGANCGEHAGQTIFHFHLHVIPRYKGDVENPRGGVRNLKPPLVKY